jgi:hypothetical protein
MYALFEKRLGYTVYSPIGGIEWGQLGITQPGTTAEYHGEAFVEDGILHIPMKYDHYDRRLITFEQFQDMDFYIILVGNGRSEVSFLNLTKKYKPKSIFIRQIANLAEKPKVCKNILLATKTPMPAGTNFLIHHPEHSPVFSYVPFKGKRTIKSFSNYLRTNQVDSAIWDRARSQLKEFEFRMHGARGDHRTVPHQNLHQAMKDSMFIWHTKAAGGCGFTCREALASGRPMIVKKQYCQAHKTLAQDYLVDGVNCIDISPGVRTLDEAVKLIRRWAEPDMYEKKCQAVLRCFKKHINFEREAEQIKAWLQTLRPGV